MKKPVANNVRARQTVYTDKDSASKSENDRNPPASKLASPGLWPTVDQELLLRAAILDGDQSRDAFMQWRSRLQDASSDGSREQQVFDQATLRLFPLLHQNTQWLPVDDVLQPCIADAYLHAWLRLNRDSRHIVPVLGLLHDDNIDTLLLKGVPLAYEYYPVPASRPMADFDVLIKSEDVHRAVAVLGKAGWRPVRELIPEDFNFRHSQSFVNNQGVEFDFHWHVMSVCCDEQADRYFWERSLPFTINGVETRRLDVTDSLLHTLVHGVAWAIEPPIRWIPDSILILRKDGDQVQWKRLVAFAEEHQLSRRLFLALDYLQRKMYVDIPTNIIHDLKMLPVHLVERLEQRPRRKLTLSETSQFDRSDHVNLLDQITVFLRYRYSINRAENPGGINNAGFFRFLAYKHRVSTMTGVGRIYFNKLSSKLQTIIARQ